METIGKTAFGFLFFTEPDSTSLTVAWLPRYRLRRPLAIRWTLSYEILKIENERQLKLDFSLIPNMGIYQAELKHGGSREWLLFVKRIGSNKFLTFFIHNRDQKCRFCDLPHEHGTKPQVHHMDYDHVCKFGQSIFRRKTGKEENKIPDCENCSKIRPEFFSSCCQRLASVHRLCNRDIEIFRRSKTP